MHSVFGRVHQGKGTEYEEQVNTFTEVAGDKGKRRGNGNLGQVNEMKKHYR
jgi:hypothetical protein